MMMFVPISYYGRLFASKSFKKNEYVTPGDLAVPIIELDWNNGIGGANGNSKKNSFENLWTDYHWSSRTYVIFVCLLSLVVVPCCCTRLNTIGDTFLILFLSLILTKIRCIVYSFPGMKEEGEDVTGASFGVGSVINWYVVFFVLS
jgi:hypothetical protein